MHNERRSPATDHAEAYRASEPTRRGDPFASPALQVALAREADQRANRQRTGRFRYLAGWFRNAPRTALASAALSLAVLLVTLSAGGIPHMGDGGELALQTPLSVASMPALGAASPEGSAVVPTAGEKAAEPLKAAEPFPEEGDLPWLVITSGAALLFSLMLIERTRRRRHA